MDFADAYHAAWALARDSTDVWTFNRKHFTRFGGLAVTVPE